MIVGGEAGGTGKREGNRMDVGGERFVQNGSFRSKKKNGGERGDGGELPGRAVIGDEQ